MFTNNHDRQQTNGGNYSNYISNAFEAVANCKDAAKHKEWLECQDFILAAKAHKMGMLPVNASSLRHFPVVAQHAVSIPHLENKLISNEIQPAFISIFRTCDAIEDAAVSIREKTKSALDQLREASIRDKREVLRYAQIIPTAIAAVYIGVSEHALKEWASLYKVFGARYAGAHSYSLAELNIIAENRLWIYSEILACAPRSTTPDDDKVLDEVTMVDYDIAAAVTDLSYSELVTQMPPNQLYNRPFRLSDLEKIRVAKLNSISMN